MPLKGSNRRTNRRPQGCEFRNLSEMTRHQRSLNSMEGQAFLWGSLLFAALRVIANHSEQLIFLNIDDLFLIHSMFGLRLQLWDGRELPLEFPAPRHPNHVVGGAIGKSLNRCRRLLPCRCHEVTSVHDEKVGDIVSTTVRIDN